jgi:hypothetical protein
VNNDLEGLFKEAIVMLLSIILEFMWNNRRKHKSFNQDTRQSD